MRGNHTLPAANITITRSIPACAGEPARCHITPLVHTVYPRVCGGTRRVRSFRYSEEGLSPRVRGNHRPAALVTTQTRSIPACAGEPWLVCESRYLDTVYPRVCGGTLSPSHADYAIHGSIPACAGEPLLTLP